MTERNEPVDPRLEEALSAALHAHAGTVRPAGDGLVRIRSRVAGRRRRVRLLAPLASVATAAAAVGAIVVSGVLASPDHKAPALADSPTSHPAVVPTTTQPPVVTRSSSPSSAVASSAVPPPSTAPVATASATLSPSTSTTALVATGPELVNPPVWPFTDAAAARTWQQSSSQKTSELWHLDPRSVATRFVRVLEQGLMLPHADLTGTAPVIAADGTATVDLTRTGPSGSTVVVGTATLAQWAQGAGQPWGVVSVTSPARSQIPLTITDPLPFAAATAPLPVTWTLTGGAEDDDHVGVWAAGATAPASFASAVTGSGTTVELSPVPPSGTGFVAVADGSSGSGAFTLARLAVTPVRYGAAAVVTAAKTYLAVVQKPNERDLQLRDATTDAVVRTVAKPKPYNFDSVTSDGQYAYVGYIALHVDCGRPISRVPLDGSGALSTVLTSATANLDSMAIGGPGGSVQAWVESPCGGATGGQTLHWRNTAKGTSGTIVSPGDPPAASALAVSPDGRQLSAFVYTGTQGNVELFDLATAQRIDQGTVPAACVSDGSYECTAASYEPNGDLVLVRSDGKQLSVLRQHDGQSTPLFSVAYASQWARVDVDRSGTRVLVSADNGHAWLWSGGDKARRLPSDVLDASW